MIEFLNSLDTSAFLAINGAHSPFFDSFMTMFTGRYIWIPMYAIVLLILFRTCRWHTAILYLSALAAAVFLTDQTCATIIRPVVERLRPSNPDSPISSLVYIVDGYRGGNYGFPSCHAANSMALAMFLTLFVKRRSFTIFIFGLGAAQFLFKAISWRALSRRPAGRRHHRMLLCRHLLLGRVETRSAPVVAPPPQPL